MRPKYSHRKCNEMEKKVEQKNALAAIIRGRDYFTAFYRDDIYASQEHDIACAMIWGLELCGILTSLVDPQTLAEADLLAASMEIEDVLNENIPSNHSYEFLTSLLWCAAEHVENLAPSIAQIIRSVAEMEESSLLEGSPFPDLSEAAKDALCQAQSEIQQKLNCSASD